MPKQDRSNYNLSLFYEIRFFTFIIFIKMPSFTRNAKIVLVWLIVVCCPNHASSLCLLCEDGVDGLKYPFAVIKSDGTMCTNLALDVSVNYEDGSEKCMENIQAWREICCGDSRPMDVEITDVFEEYPVNDEALVGPYDRCNVCRDGDYPSATGMVISMLYAGTGSCQQFWKVGQQGLIPTHLCDPLQYYA
jgi:hypothetical protein